ncbi:MAG: type II toxin-antitoxin system PemK/MazF family toxin [bacterium]
MRTPLRGDVWSIDLNPVRGREQSGTRPAVVISANGFNNSAADLVIVLPITSKKKNIPLHVEVIPPQGGLKTISYIKCEDVRSVSKERLAEFLGIVPEAKMAEVERLLKLLLVL